MEFSAKLSVHADQGVVGACVTDGSSSGIEVPGVGFYGNGYCLLLSSETQNGSSRGAFLMSGDASGNGRILADKLFSPTYGQTYELALTRNCLGEFTFSVDGNPAGTALNTSAMSFDTVLLVGGEDDFLSTFSGGRVHDVRFRGCR